MQTVVKQFVFSINFGEFGAKSAYFFLWIFLARKAFFNVCATTTLIYIFTQQETEHPLGASGHDILVTNLNRNNLGIWLVTTLKSEGK